MPQRRKLVVGLALAGATLATAGPVFACVTFKGKLTLTGSNTLTHTVRGDGTSTHGYCWPAGGPQDGGPLVAGNLSGQTMKVDIAPASCDGVTNQLAGGSYQVALVNGPGFTSTGYLSPYSFVGALNWGCWATSPSYTPSQKYTGFPGSAFTISATGFGSTTITVPSLPVNNEIIMNPTDASVLCVAPAGTPSPGSSGIMAPFTVL